MFTYTVGKPPEGDAKLVLTITDDGGRQIRRLDVSKSAGINRVTWNLRGEPPAGGGRGGGGQGGRRRGGHGRRSRWRRAARVRRVRAWPQAPLVAPGRYRATLGRLSGDTVTPIGQPQTFVVMPLAR